MDSLKDCLSQYNKLPAVIGKFSLEGTDILNDGALQIYYKSENNKNGYFTITIYNSGIYVSDELDNPLILNEYLNCKNVFKIMEDRGYYQNVRVLIEEPYRVSKNTEPEFLNMVLMYFHRLENGDYVAELSSFYLRSNFGYFHKIRFSDVSDEPEKNISDMKYFIKTWNEFVKNMDLRD
ncbi:MAG TPA: hypothetical protein PL041_12855 [Melioribacteraceae bacterium]|nr:hypothetical protein [Melioribacteraceae bacterium]